MQPPDYTIRIWDSKNGELRKVLRPSFEPVPGKARVVDATDWEFEWLDEGRILIQFRFRESPTRASYSSILGVIGAERGEVERLSERLDIGELLYPSKDGHRAIASQRFGIWRGSDGDVHRGGQGTTHEVAVLDLDRMEVSARIGGKASTGSQSEIFHAMWLPKNQWIATAADDHAVRLWSGIDGTLIATMKGHSDWILGLSVSPDSTQLLSYSADGSAKVWSLPSGKPLHSLAPHRGGMNAAVFSSDGTFALTAGEDGALNCQSLTASKCRITIAPHESAIRWIRIGPDSHWVDSVTAGMQFRRASLEDGRVLLHILASEDTVSLDPCGSSLLLRMANDELQLWTLK